MKSDVYVIKGDNPAQMSYEAISMAFKEDANGKSVLLKVNTGFKGQAASGLCTHPEIVRGLIKFFKERNVGKLYVGDSSIVGTNSIEALKSAGIYDVCTEEKVECVNLDDSGVREVQIPEPVMIDSLKLSNLPFQVDILISVPVIKTHMYAGVTLGIKNMKGCLFQRDKTRLHRIYKEVPDKNKGKGLDYGIMDLAKVCYPDYTVADGFIAMEGFGPSGGTPVNLGVVVASNNPVANDLVCMKLMGMEYDDVPHINLVRENKGFKSEDLQVHPANYMDYSHKFVLASEHDLHLAYKNPTVIDKGACSACHSAMVQFFRYHHQEYTESSPIKIAIGRDLKLEDLQDDYTVIVGNCTAKFRDDFPFCKGCPPVPSQIARTINERKTLDD